MKNRFTYAIVVFFLSLSISYMAWALPWEKYVFLSMQPGSRADFTKITVEPAFYLGTADENTRGDFANKLEQITKQHNVAVYVSYVDTGRPESVVMDPEHVLSWMPKNPQKNIVYPFRGMYAEDKICDKIENRFFPPGYVCGESLVKEASVEDKRIQYARLWDENLPLVYGSYVITTSDVSVVKEVVHAFEDYFAVRVSSQIHDSFISFLKKEPIFSIGTFFLLASVVMSIVFFTVNFLRTSHSLYLAWVSGSSKTKLIINDVKDIFIFLFVSSLLAAIVVASLPFVVSLSTPVISWWDVFVWGWCASFFISFLLFFVVDVVGVFRVVRKWEYA
ncbi:MAG: hypothetical protein J6M18_00830 [Actinomycetaceae bacterium]|nr:hypothetical protein [Actinomycetaceae bacterium]